MHKQLDGQDSPVKLDLSKFDKNLIEELQKLSVLQQERVAVSLKRPIETDRKGTRGSIQAGDPKDN